MPYNNTPIPPPKEYNGQTCLPLARVKKIINADPDISHCSLSAQYAIALATELFLQHLVRTTHNVVKAERKPRRNIQYRDVAAAISKTDNLEFLVDVVPKTVTYGEAKKRRTEKGLSKTPGLEPLDKGKEKAGADIGKMMNGEVKGKGKGRAMEDVMDAPKTVMEDVDGGSDATSPISDEDEVAGTPEPDAMDVDGEEDARAGADEGDEEEQEEDPAAMQLEMEMRAPRRSGGTYVNGTK